MERLNGQRLQLEQQINTLESANLNLETMQVMKKASDVLENIHGHMLAWFSASLVARTDDCSQEIERRGCYDGEDC